MITLKGWRGPELQKVMKAKAAQRLQIAAILLTNDIKVMLSTPYPPASTAGEPPHKREGRLRASVAYQIDAAKMQAQVGSNLAYARFLEMGTIKMAARPFLRRALANNLAAIKKIIAGK